MTITNEILMDRWKKVDGKYRYSKKCFVIGKFVTIIGELLFAVSIIALTYYATVKNVAKLETFLTYVGVCGGLILALCVCWTMLVHIFYHPFKAKYVENALLENAKSMVEMAVKTRTNSKKIQKGISNGAWCIYILAVMIDVTATYAGIWETCVYKLVLSNFINMDKGGLVLMPVVELIILCLIHKIFKFIIRWLYFCPVSYKDVLRAEEIRVEIEEETAEKSEKERLILSDYLLENGISALGRDALDEAKDYFLKSAILGNLVGMDRLALFHASIEVDKEIAVYWYKKCIASGVATKDTKKHLWMAKNGIKVDNYY